MNDLVYTICSDNEVDINDEESSDEEITVVTEKQRKKKKNEQKLFNPSFKFVEEDGGIYTNSPMDDAMQACLKRNRRPKTSVEDKINELRSLKADTSVVEVNEDLTAADLPEDEVVDDDDEANVVKDKLEVKAKRGKNKVDIEYGSASVPLADVVDGTKTEENLETWNSELSFTDMNLSKPLLKAITAMNYSTPTPIQQAAIPLALRNRDICGCAATGTGKTAAFMLPVLERLINKPASSPATRVLCLLPTRELAVQVYTVSRQLAQHTNIRITLAAGGMDRAREQAALRLSPDIVVATPGRLNDHILNTSSFTLDNIEVLILDEADRMLDEYFEEQMTRIIKHYLKPSSYQTLLFSATLSDQVESLIADSLKNPVRITVNSNTDVAPFLRQEFVKIRENKEGDREAIVAALCSRSFLSSVLVFCQTKKQAHRMHILLGLCGIKAAELHSDLGQEDRLKSLKRFKMGEADVLVCTDVASRGLDINNVKTVINLTMPNTHQHYVHRVGRTARAGKTGRSVSLVGEGERKLLKQIIKSAKTAVKKRVMAAEVITKYREKLLDLEPEVGEIMKMEAVEKKILSTENKVNRAQKQLAGEEETKRVWFQKKIERELTRAEKSLGVHSNAKGANGGKKKGGKFEKKAPATSDERMAAEMLKSKQFRKRVEKRKNKPKRCNAVVEDAPPKKKQKVQKAGSSGFEKDLTNTSTKGVKKFRNIKKRGGSFKKKK